MVRRRQTFEFSGRLLKGSARSKKRRDRETRKMRTMRTARSVWAVNSKDNKKDRGREEDVVHEMTTFSLKIDNDWPEIGHALRETDSS